MKLRIVPMTARHLPAVAELERVCFPADPWSEDLFRDALENPRVCPLLAQGEDGAVLGEVVLAIAGLMSDDTLENVNRDLENAKAAAFQLGVSREIDPFMTLSFMSLPVIPTLRLTTRGVIDVEKQQYV